MTILLRIILNTMLIGSMLAFVSKHSGPGLGVAVSNRGLRSSVGRGVAGWVSVVSGMIAGCDRCAAGGAVRRSA
jgi:hypothetical protein